MDEFGVAHGRAEFAAKRTEGPIRVTVHGREERITVNGYVADVKIGRGGIVHHISLNTNKVIRKYNWFGESGLLRKTDKRIIAHTV